LRLSKRKPNGCGCGASVVEHGAERSRDADLALFLVNPGLAPQRATVGTMYTAYRLNNHDELRKDTLDASVLIVEQDINQALAFANRVYVLANGRVRFEGSPRELDDNEVLRKLLPGF
jgi:ABC-type uncharacterized transport system ATPase subunit